MAGIEEHLLEFLNSFIAALGSVIETEEKRLEEQQASFEREVLEFNSRQQKTKEDWSRFHEMRDTRHAAYTKRLLELQQSREALERLEEQRRKWEEEGVPDPILVDASGLL